MSVDPQVELGRLRHDLRTPLNAILGYSEMVLEETDAAQFPEFTAALQATNTLGKELLEQLGRLLDGSRLAAGATLAEVTAELPATLGPPLERLTTLSQTLQQQVAGGGLDDVEADVKRIVTAARKLREMVAGLSPRAPGGRGVGGEGDTRSAGKAAPLPPAPSPKRRGGEEEPPAPSPRRRGGDEAPLPPAPSPRRRGGDEEEKSPPISEGSTSSAPPSLVGKGAGGLGPSSPPLRLGEGAGERGSAREETASPASRSSEESRESVNIDPEYHFLLEEDPTRRLRHGHILIVDDQEHNRNILGRHLHREQRFFALANNGLQALEMLESQAFDLVLLDIMMPELDGFEVLKRIKSNPQLAHVPVIMVSALDDIAGVVRCIEMGAADYLPKPFDPVLLRARVNACLEQKRLRDRELDYLRQVANLTDAAATLEAGAFQGDALAAVGLRNDPLGQLARVFLRMAREVQAREQRLQQQVQQLRIEIDQTRKSEQVAEITESQYFRDLQARAQSLRQRKKDGG